ncbi:MAG: alanine--glyoxylate aminotransferase family protein [Methanocorpusculum parvum]|nr:alanine--glyoxylate aminotransferase family protein [Methanocorpusculum parvum]
MKLFTIGPVQMYPCTLQTKSLQVPYFRTQEFSDMILEISSLLKKFVGTSSDSEVILLTGSGTAAMEGSVINCFTKMDKLLIVNGGSFGQRFCDICDCYSIPYEVLSLEFGEVLDKQHLEPFANSGFTGFLVNLDETSTGQLYDIELISQFCHENHLCLVVDAISTFLCDNYSMDKYGIDVTIISSQKGLSLSPGLSAVIINHKTVTNRVLQNTPQTLYFDFKDYIKNMGRGQTPYTPAVGIVCELSAILHYIDSIGVDTWIRTVSERAEYFRHKLSQFDSLEIPSYSLSNAITPVIFKQPIAEKVFFYLKDEKGLFVNPSGGAFAEKMFRVSHVGNLFFDDYDELIAGIAEAVELYSSV